MESNQGDDRELRLTAALYLKVGGKALLEHVKATGRLPKNFKGELFFVIPMRLLIEERGTDITLTPDEQLVYDAIVRGKNYPAGKVNLVDKN